MVSVVLLQSIAQRLVLNGSAQPSATAGTLASSASAIPRATRSSASQSVKARRRMFDPIPKKELAGLYRHC
jgi:hypothetical protein